MLLLAACNTDETQIPKTSASIDETTNENDINEQPEVAPLEPTVQEEPTEQSKQVQDSTNDSTLTYVSNSQEFTEKTTISASNELNYTIQHFTNFTLSAEEPGKDMLLYNDNDALSMRIEVFATAEASFADIVTDTENSTLAIAPDGKFTEIDLTTYIEDRDEIFNSSSFLVEYESDKVISVIYELKDKILRLTVYDDYITDLTDAFLQMGFTIQ